MRVGYFHIMTVLNIILLATLLVSVYGSVYNRYYGQALPISAETPRVILQQGTSGITTIYTNNTSAKVSVIAPRNWWNANYDFCRQISIVNNIASTLSSGYSVCLTANTTSLVSAGKMLPNGNDLRIVYWNRSSWVEIDRDIIGINTSSTQVWFKTQANISAIGSDSSYYMYYGNPFAANPPANKNNVYDFWDDFDDGSLDPAWTFSQIGGASGSYSESGTVLILNATNSGDLWGASDSFLFLSFSRSYDVLVESYTSAWGGSHDTWSKMGGVQLRQSLDANSKNRIMSPVYSAVGATNSYRLSTEGSTFEQTTVTQSKYCRLSRIGGTSRAWYSTDGASWMELGSQISFSGGLSNPVRIGIHLAGLSSSSHWVEVDWFKVRGYVDPEPSVSVGSEESYSYYPNNYNILSGNWWNLDWQYRRPIMIDNTQNINNLTNFQVKVSVTYDPDIQPDFDDIRFTDSDGISSINFWRETYTASTLAIYWVRIPNIPASSIKTIYMYYGNSGATTASNITGVLEATYTKVDVSYVWEPRISTTDVADGDDVGSWQNFPFNFPYWRELKSRAYVCSNGFAILDPTAATTDWSNSLSELQARWKIAPFWDDLRTDVSGGIVSSPGTYVDNYTDRIVITWETTRYGASADSIKFQTILYPNGDIRISIENATNFANFTPTLGVSKGDNTNYIDVTSERATFKSWLFLLRKYTSPEPTTTIGDEETTYHVSGTVPQSVETVDSNYLITKSAGSATTATSYYPSGYTLGGSTTWVSGEVSNLTSNDGVYMTFRSYESLEWGPWSDELLTNPGFEMGNLTGWTAKGPAAASVEVFDAISGGDGYTQRDFRIGNYGVCTKDTPGTNDDSGVWQNVSLTAYADAIDAGNAVINASAWLYPSEWTYDDCALIVRFYNSSGGFISAWNTTGEYGQGTAYYPKAWMLGSGYDHFTQGELKKFGCYNYTIPVGTRTVGIQLGMGEHKAASYCGGQADEASIKVRTKNVNHITEVEFTGSSNTYTWAQLNVTVDSSWTVGSVDVFVQVYDWTAGQYSTSGKGYLAYTSGANNTDETKILTITTNAQDFRNATGNWKIKIKGVKNTATQFDFKADWIEFKPTHYNEYTVSTEFLFSSITPNTPTQLNFTVVSEYDIADVSVTIQVWNYSSSAYVTSGEGYLTYTSTGVNETKLLSINTTPQFYTSNGNAKIKVTGVKSTTTQFRQKVNQIKLTYKYNASSTYDYVLKTNNTVTDAWKINLKVYNSSNIGRLLNATISFHDGTTSDQIIINGGVITQPEGQLYDIAGNATIYISISNLQATNSDVSYLYVYLKILVPNTSTYNLFIIAFEIT